LTAETGECSHTKRKLRCNEQVFDWKTTCFLCGMPALVDEKHPKRNPVYPARTLELYDSVMDMCTKRCDSWSDEVQGRLQQCIDFVAGEAVYHQKCKVMFRLGKCKPLVPKFPFRQQRIQRVYPQMC